MSSRSSAWDVDGAPAATARPARNRGAKARPRRGAAPFRRGNVPPEKGERLPRKGERLNRALEHSPSHLERSPGPLERSPRPSGTFSPASGTFPPVGGTFSPMPGTFPQASGTLPPPGGRLPLPGERRPPSLGTSPLGPGRFPPLGASFPSRSGTLFRWDRIPPVMNETNEETETSGEAPLRQALRSVTLLADLAEAEIDWLAENAEEIHLADGEVISREGEPAERMSIVLAGELRGRNEKGAVIRTFIAQAGEITGLLPVLAHAAVGRHHPRRRPDPRRRDLVGSLRRDAAAHPRAGAAADRRDDRPDARDHPRRAAEREAARARQAVRGAGARAQQSRLGDGPRGVRAPPPPRRHAGADRRADPPGGRARPDGRALPAARIPPSRAWGRPRCSIRWPSRIARASSATGWRNGGWRMPGGSPPPSWPRE